MSSGRTARRCGSPRRTRLVALAAMTTTLVIAPFAAAETPTPTGTRPIVATRSAEPSGPATADSTPVISAAATATATVGVSVTVSASPTAGPKYQPRQVRVGVQIDASAYVADGTTTTGSILRIVETGPALSEPLVTTCVTQPDPDPPTGSTASFCPDLVPNRAGDTLTLTQLATPPGLVVDQDAIVIEPCDLDVDAECGRLIEVVFDARGLPPSIDDDTAVADSGGSVEVDVLANDNTRAPVRSLTVSAQPAHGSAQVVDDDDGEQVIRYTANDGYRGVDSFSYAIRTANGSATATVTIKVSGPASADPTATTTETTGPTATTTVTTEPATTTTVTTEPAGASSSASIRDRSLAATGGPGGSGLGVGLGLLLTGAGATLIGRRRKVRGRHV